MIQSIVINLKQMFIEKENIIRLGRSKSQTNRKNSNTSRKSSIDKQNQMSTGFMTQFKKRQSRYKTGGQLSNKSISNQCNNQHNQCRVLMRQTVGPRNTNNQVTAIRTSSRIQYIPRNNNSNNNSNINIVNRNSKILEQRTIATTDNQQNQQQQQSLLHRKIKILQLRIQQLHQQKQHTTITLNQQISKLTQQNNTLRKYIQECSKVKNMEIQYLKNQIEIINKNVNIRQQSKSKSIVQNQSDQSNNNMMMINIPKLTVTKSEQKNQFSSLKNSIYVVEDLIAINKQQQQQYEPKQFNNKQHQYKKYRQQHQQHQQQLIQKQINQQLTKQISQLKQTIISASIDIQDNSNKILKQYINKINQLEQSIKMVSQENVKLTEYVYKMKIQIQSRDIKIRQSENNYLMENTNKQIKYKQQSQLMLSEKVHEIQRLNIEIQLLQKQLNKIKQSDYKSCNKCKQLIATLVKLNHKAIAKVM